MSDREAKTSLQGAVMNLAELLERVDNDRELLRDLLTIFKEEFPDRVRELRKAVESENAKQVAAVSHTLKGMLANLAANSAADAAAEIEHASVTGKMPALRERLTAFEREAERLLPEVENHLIEAAN